MRTPLWLVVVVALLVNSAFPGGQSAPVDQSSRQAVGDIGSWVSIGPSPVTGSVDYPNSFQSGRVAAFAADPANSQHWLVGVGNGGVWESLDAGTSWRPISDAAPTLATGAIAFAPSDNRVIYVGTGESAGVGFTHVGVGLLKSIDAGRTWSVLGASSLARAAVRRLRVHPSNPNVVIVATTRAGAGKDSLEGVASPPPHGVLKSVDGGVSWTRTLGGQATALEISSTTFANQYAAIGGQFGTLPGETPGVINGVYRSTDGGDTWSRIDGPWGLPPGRVELAMSVSSPNVLYASVQIGGNASLYRTDTAWAAVPSWTAVPLTALPAGYCGPGKCGYSHVISVDPTNPNTLFAGGAERGFWRCSSCGASPTWTDVLAPNPEFVHPDFHTLEWVGARLVAGNDGGIWSSPDLGRSWQNHNGGLTTGMFYSAALHPTDGGFLIGGLRDYTPVVSGSENRWRYLPAVSSAWEWGEAEVALASSHPTTHWMLAWLRGDVQRTTDGGLTGIKADAGIDKTGAAFVAPVRKCPVDDDVFVTGSNRMWRTNAFFSAVTPSWSANGPVQPGALGTINAIAFAPAEAGCATYAYGTRGGEIYLTRDGGTTWSNLDPSRTLPARPINGVAFHPAASATAYVALSSFDNGTPGAPGHIFKTVNALDAAPVWRDVSPPVDVPFNVVAIDPRTPALVYAGSDTGLWRSTDAGGSWSRLGLDVGLPPATVHDVQINPVTDTTVVLTYGRGAYRLLSAAVVRPPTDVRVVSVVNSSVTVSFRPPIDGITPTGYVLEGGVAPGQVLGSVPIGVAATTLTFNAPQGAFYIRVHTLAGAQRSGPSNEARLFVNVPTRPAAPANLLYTIDGSTLSLAWMNSTNGIALTGNGIIVRGSASMYVPLGVTESLTVPGVPAGTYDLWVNSVNPSGDSANSNPVTVRVPGPCSGTPGAPLNVAVIATGRVLTVRWDLPGSGPAPTSFLLDVTGAFVGRFPLAARTVSGGVGPGAYTFAVTSQNSCGTSPPSLPVTVVVP